MIIMKAIVGLFLLIVFTITSADFAFSQDDLSSEIKDPELEQEFKWLKAETFVITASRLLEEINKAPASITVITDIQIRKLGARDLRDVLRAVPGFHFDYYFARSSTFLARGLGNSGAISNGILLMINSHPVNEVVTGGFNWFHDTLIVDNAKRIEFVRGPGSAIYGANAYSGVIMSSQKKQKISMDLKSLPGEEVGTPSSMIFSMAKPSVNWKWPLTLTTSGRTDIELL